MQTWFVTQLNLQQISFIHTINQSHGRFGRLYPDVKQQSLSLSLSLAITMTILINKAKKK